METISLAGEWKLRGEFLDVTADQYVRVLEAMEAEPESNSLPGYLQLSDLSPEEKEAFLQKPPREFTIYHVGNEVFPSKTGYLPMQVPGDVSEALMKAGLLKDPMVKTNSKDCLWTRDLSWWLVKEFDAGEELLDHDIVLLYIEMLDYNADILINGRPAGHHANAFCPYRENVRNFLRPGKNQIIIRLTGGMELHYPHDSVSVYCASPFALCDQRIYTRKPQFTYGWDWCQPIPTCGIGRSICLEAFTGARVSSARVDTYSIGNDQAKLEFCFELEKSDMVSSAETVLEYSLEFQGKTVFSGRETLILTGGLNYFTKMVCLENPRLWWPNGYGDQNLYVLKAFCLSNGIQNDMKPIHVGIRTIEIDQSPLSDGTRNFFFKVNGVRIFCKGGNWVPTDSLYLRSDAERYRTLVSEAAGANFTMLRVWGGGTYEPDCFYEYCSEYGILLMHDFMYACGFYPDFDKSFLYEAQQEAEYQTKRLSHFPCMAVWTGNNEIAESYTDWFDSHISPDRLYGEKIFNYIQPQAVHENSPLIPYMPSTPYFGDRANKTEEGDVHAWTYFGRDKKTKFKYAYELEAFDRFPARFSSEFGFFGPLMESSVKRYHDGEEIVYGGPIWKHHGEQDRKRKSIDAVIDRHLTDFSSLDYQQYLVYGGIMQGLLYKEMAEALRRKSYGAGDLIWMYNDCWPETGWTIIDYYLTRKISYYFLKRAFSPKKLIIREEPSGAQLTVINETPHAIQTQITCGYMSFDGRRSCEQVISVTAPPHSWRQYHLDEKKPAGISDGFYVAESPDFETADSLRAYYRNHEFPESHAKITKTQPDEKDLLITVKADVYTPFVYLSAGDDRIHYSDNYFPLYPGKEKTVRQENSLTMPEIAVVPTSYCEKAPVASK